MGGAPYHKKGRPVFFQNVNGVYVHMHMHVHTYVYAYAHACTSYIHHVCMHMHMRVHRTYIHTSCMA